METQAQRKLLSVLCHGSIFFNYIFIIVPIIVPLGILCLTNDSVVKENAREAINYNINFYFFTIIFLFLSIFLIGVPLIVILFLVTWIMPIIAISEILRHPGITYRYPGIFRLV